MPVFRLTRRLVFPSPHLADADGLLAVGGDLSEERLLLAYAQGIFPWYSEGSPILWWSPDPRLVLFPGELKVSRSLRQTINRQVYRVTMDTSFAEVIGHCSAVARKRETGTWITEDMQAAYIRLHAAGYAHSVESRQDGELVGGLYGVALGSVFFGESMFSLKDNASKVAFAALVSRLRERGFTLIDCQVHTGHLVSLGAREIPRARFMKLLQEALKAPTHRGSWNTPG